MLVDKSTRVVVQGITGRQGVFHTLEMLKTGTKVVAGVTPGKAGETVHGVPVYDLVSEAMDEHPEANAAISFVPPGFVKDAAFEAMEAGLSPIVIVAEGVPTSDAMEIVTYALTHKVRVIGPDTPGVYSPGKCKLGFHPDRCFREGCVGVLAKGGGISYEVSNQVSLRGLGVSTCVNIGGDRITGMDFSEILGMFEKDPETKAIALLGEIGGSMEEEAAEFIKRNVSKPVIALILGRGAPAGRRMGHAGAIVEMGAGSYESKVRALRDAGAYIARDAFQAAEIVSKILE